MDSLFPLPQSEPVKRSTTLNRGGKPTWTKYRPAKRVACDECVLVLHENKGIGQYPRSARWSRRTPGGDAVRLCYEHAELWKKEDGRE
jgi:hypothetical protein